MTMSRHLEVGAINLNRALARTIDVLGTGGSGEPSLPVERARL